MATSLQQQRADELRRADIQAQLDRAETETFERLELEAERQAAAAARAEWAHVSDTAATVEFEQLEAVAILDEQAQLEAAAAAGADLSLLQSPGFADDLDASAWQQTQSFLHRIGEAIRREIALDTASDAALSSAVELCTGACMLELDLLSAAQKAFRQKLRTTRSPVGDMVFMEGPSPRTVLVDGAPAAMITVAAQPSARSRQQRGRRQQAKQWVSNLVERFPLAARPAHAA
eukprot:jgi/Tetstr1/424682/TSEL_015203.t1